MPSFGSLFASIQTPEYKKCRTLPSSRKGIGLQWLAQLAEDEMKWSQVPGSNPVAADIFVFFFIFLSNPIWGYNYGVFFFEFFSSNPTWGSN
jgi:hypothetical protein